MLFLFQCKIKRARQQRVLCSMRYMTHGFPEKILSDNGQEFMSGMMQKLWELLNIHKVTTAPYHPQSDGKNENSHKFIFKIMKIICEGNLDNWPEYAKVAQFAWNISSVPWLAGLSPYELMHGQQPQMPHSLSMMRVPTEEELVKSGKDYDSYAEELTDWFEVMHAAFRDARIKAAVDLTYKHALSMKPVKEIEWLKPGKLVVVYRPTSSKDGENWTKKLLYQFKGPFRIIKLFRNPVHMVNLDGSKASSHSIDNVYPYSAKCNEVME